MAKIKVSFRNIENFHKCAFSSPRIDNLDIRDESPDGAIKAALHGISLNQASHKDNKSGSNSICGSDDESDNNLNYSSLSSSNLTCDKRPSNKITSNNEINLFDLLNSNKLENASELNVENFKAKETTVKDKMKISANLEVDDGLSELLSSIAHDSSGRDEVDANLECFRKKDREIDILNFDFAKSECTESSFLSKNVSLKAEDNLSELLSTINIEDSNVAQIGFNASNSNSKFANKPKEEKEPIVTDLSDLLSSIDIGNYNDTKVSSHNKDKCQMKVEKTNESCLADLLASIDIKSNSVNAVKEPCVADFSELLSSIDLGNSNVKKVGDFKEGKMCNTKDVKHKELDLTDFLSPVDINKANKSVFENKSCVTDLSDLLSSIDLGDSNNNKFSACNPVEEIKKVSDVASLPSVDTNKLNNPSSQDTSNLSCKDTNGVSNSLDFPFDISSCSSSNSCASSYSDKENSSASDSDKVSESESGYNSYDSVPKEFSFFNLSDNQMSFNTLLTQSLDMNISKKPVECKNARNTNKEISMSDLLTIVSPEFKNSVWAALNEDNDSSSMLESIESLNIKSKNSKNSVNDGENPIYYNFIDEQTSKKVQKSYETSDLQVNSSLEQENVSIQRNILNDDDKIGSDDEQITFIDLRECIKSAKHHFTPTSPHKQVKTIGNQSLEGFSPKKVLFYCEEKTPSVLSQSSSNSKFEFNNTILRKKIKVNTKQTLFSKALACKPRKDQSLLLKVASIKKELLNNFKCRPIFLDCDVPQPILESVIQTDKCILPNEGLRSFGLKAPQESQY